MNARLWGPARGVVCALALLASVGAARDAHAQDLTRIDSLIATGRFTDARDALATWVARNPRSAAAATPEEQAHAGLLAGRLASDPATAFDAYLAVALGFPTSDHAPVALLRLGQGLLASGEPERARGYLERLARDYPNAPGRAATLLWLARAQRASGRAALACSTLHDALMLPDVDTETTTLLHNEQPLACTNS